MAQYIYIVYNCDVIALFIFAISLLMNVKFKKEKIRVDYFSIFYLTDRMKFDFILHVTSQLKISRELVMHWP